MWVLGSYSFSLSLLYGLPDGQWETGLWGSIIFALSFVWDIRLAQQHLTLSNDCGVFSTLSICEVQSNLQIVST